MSAILDFYGLRFQPFPQRLDDVEKKYETNDLKQTNAVLRYALSEMGVVLICGDTGRGTSMRCIVQPNPSREQTTPSDTCRFSISVQGIFTKKHVGSLEQLLLAEADRQ